MKLIFTFHFLLNARYYLQSVDSQNLLKRKHDYPMKMQCIILILNMKTIKIREIKGLVHSVIIIMWLW